MQLATGGRFVLLVAILQWISVTLALPTWLSSDVKKHNPNVADDLEKRMLSGDNRMQIIQEAYRWLRNLEKRKFQEDTHMGQLELSIRDADSDMKLVRQEIAENKYQIQRLQRIVCLLMDKHCEENKEKCFKCPWNMENSTFTKPTKVQKATPTKAPKVTPSTASKVTPSKGPKVTPSKSPKVTPSKASKVTPTKASKVTINKTSQKTTKAPTTTPPKVTPMKVTPSKPSKVTPTTTTVKPTIKAAPNITASCGSPESALQNGYTKYTVTTLNAVAELFCNAGYDLIGRSRRTCIGIWNNAENMYDYSWAPPMSAACKANGEPTNPITPKATTKKPTVTTSKPTKATIKSTKATVKSTKATVKPTKATVKPKKATVIPTKAAVESTPAKTSSAKKAKKAVEKAAKKAAKKVKKAEKVKKEILDAIKRENHEKRAFVDTEDVINELALFLTTRDQSTEEQDFISKMKQRDDMNVIVPTTQRKAPGLPSRCSYEPIVGECPSLEDHGYKYIYPSPFVRYYYDNNVGRCREFIYGGCGPHNQIANRFYTKDDCERKCQPYH